MPVSVRALRPRVNPRRVRAPSGAGRHGWCHVRYGRPGHGCSRRAEVPAPAAYAVFDCETTGTAPERDEIVSLAVVRLDADGVETRRFARLVRPSRPIPAEATAVHGITDDDVASAPRFARDRAASCSSCSTAPCSSRTTRLRPRACCRHAFAARRDRLPPRRGRVHARRVPAARAARREPPARVALPTGAASSSMTPTTLWATRSRPRRCCACSSTQGIAPETVRARPRGVPAAALPRRHPPRHRAADPQSVRPRTLGRLLTSDGVVDRAQVVALVQRVAGTTDVDSLTREQVQDVYDALDGLIAAQSVSPRPPRRELGRQPGLRPRALRTLAAWIRTRSRCSSFPRSWSGWSPRPRASPARSWRAGCCRPPTRTRSRGGRRSRPRPSR